MFDPAIDMIDPETHADNPWRFYDWLREEHPLHYDEANKLWTVSRYDDIVYVAKNSELFHSREGNRPGLPYDGSFIHLDGKQHHERRGLLRKRFGPSGIKRLEGHIRDVCGKLIDDVAARGECEFVEDIAAKLPMAIIAEMTGIPEKHHNTCRRYLDIFCTGGNGPTHVTEEVNEAFYAWAAIHFELVMERTIAPKDDLLSLWIAADNLTEAPFDEENMLFEHTMLLVGGSETTRNVITGGLEQLLKHPEQLAWLREHPEGLPNAVEEMLRWTTPFVSMSRTATQDVEWQGKTIKKHDEIMMLYPAANRDPRKFVDPYTFDIHRDFKTPPISFGYGAHFCIGARLARTEARILFEELFNRWGHIEARGEPVFSRSSFMRGIHAFELGFTPVRAEAAK
jgi:cytochrome P450 family 142 subfamily A polypeptide 1